MLCKIEYFKAKERLASPVLIYFMMNTGTVALRHTCSAGLL